jgi:methylglutaconyl-CoA hydratase
MAWKRLQRVAEGPEPLAPTLARRSHRLADELRKGGGQRRDGSSSAALHPGADQALGADEDVEPLEEVGRELLPRGVGHLQAGEVGYLLAEPLDDGHRYRIAARLCELVEIEGRRRARSRRSLEVAPQGVLVQLEVGRRDDGDRVRPPRGRMRRERHCLCSRLRPAVHDDGEPAAARVDEEVAEQPPLLDPEQDPLAGRAHDQDAVEAAGGEELHQRADGRLVERRPIPAERRHSGRERALDHHANLMLTAMSALRIEREGELLRVTMVRPERRNAFDAALIAELAEAFADIGDARAVVLAGEGPSFSAGADVEWQRASIDLSFDENVEDAMRLYTMLQAIDECPAPVVARVQGHALGGGSGLVGCADIVLTAEDAVFGFTEVRLGIIPAVISPFVFRKIGQAAARRYFLTGERFDARTAVRIGLADEIVGDLDAAVETVAADLLAGGPEAVRAAKKLARERPEGIETARIAAERRTSAEGQEGLRAFLEKRAPAWRSETSS